LRAALASLLAAILLAGCAALPGHPLAARDQISNFALEARFALRISLPGQAEQSSGGRLSWVQKNGNSRLLLSSPLGYGLAEIESTPGHAILRMANSETRESSDPDALMEEVSGQPLPVSRLPAWLLGHGAGQTTIERDPLGRPQHLEEAGWRVDYAYDNDAADALPARLTLNRDDQIELRLRIEEWRDAP